MNDVCARSTRVDPMGLAPGNKKPTGLCWQLKKKHPGQAARAQTAPACPCKSPPFGVRPPCFGGTARSRGRRVGDRDPGRRAPLFAQHPCKGATDDINTRIPPLGSRAQLGRALRKSSSAGSLCLCGLVGLYNVARLYAFCDV